MDQVMVIQAEGEYTHMSLPIFHIVLTPTSPGVCECGSAIVTTTANTITIARTDRCSCGHYWSFIWLIEVNHQVPYN